MLNFLTTSAIKSSYYPLGFLNKIGDASTVNWPALAFTRFVLAFIVVAAHILTYANDPGPLIWISRFKAFNAILGFLLISGFSIGKSIVRDKDGYLLRRAQRIYPVYLAALLLTTLINPPQLSTEFALTLIINTLFLNQLLTSTSYVGPAWTLALEVWLYLLAPYFLKMTYRQLITLVVLSFFSYSLYKCGRTLFDWPYYSGVGYGLNLILLAFTWLLGFMLATFTGKTRTTSILIIATFATHFLINTIIDSAYRVVHNQLDILFTQSSILFFFEFLCLLFILVAVLHYRNTLYFSISTQKIFTFLGNISYPLYLTHIASLDLSRKMHITNWLLLTTICLSVSCLVYWSFDFYSKKRSA